MNDPENMTSVMNRNLERMADLDDDPLKDATRAILHLYKRIEQLQDEVDSLSSRLEDIENR
jgi:hypothetical protein